MMVAVLLLAGRWMGWVLGSCRLFFSCPRRSEFVFLNVIYQHLFNRFIIRHYYFV
jgi:hypothetical protein